MCLMCSHRTTQKTEHIKPLFRYSFYDFTCEFLIHFKALVFYAIYSFEMNVLIRHYDFLLRDSVKTENAFRAVPWTGGAVVRIFFVRPFCYMLHTLTGRPRMDQLFLNEDKT